MSNKPSVEVKFDEEQSKLDDAIAKEEEEDEKKDSPFIKTVFLGETEKTPPKAEKTSCFKKTGVISSLESNHGTIDNGIFFDRKVAQKLQGELRVGARVIYLANQEPHSDYIDIVKIEQIIDDCWDAEPPTAEDIEKGIRELRNEEPKYFSTDRRNIFGAIIDRKLETVLIDLEYTQLNVNLDNVEIDFIPKEGDMVIVECNVQTDADYIDYCGEILNAIKISPTRRESSENCVVTKIYEDWGGILGLDCYFTFDILPGDCKVEVGDRVSVEKIECAGKFPWRCIKLTVTERAAPNVPSNGQIITPKNNEKHSISVTDNIRCVLKNFSEQKTLEIIVKNISQKVQIARQIIVVGRKCDSQLQIIEPLNSFELNPGEQITIRIQVIPKLYGAKREIIQIAFNNFRVYRSIEVIVSEDAYTEAENDKIISNRYTNQRDTRRRANKILSRKIEVIPGVGFSQKPRFIAQRIGFFEVPERLRAAFLTSCSRSEMISTIEELFPSIQNHLTFGNYVSRFQTLLHLEELEYYVSMRKYDRERAHFTRDGEYLSLTIENLAEKRPSLVIGDSIRAINPWSDSDEFENRCYDGVIHKVLFDRILIKFNAGFQSKYNGEDYQLEFNFSRFGFRKQHFSINRFVHSFDEAHSILFPLKIKLREKPCLDVELNADMNLVIANEVESSSVDGKKNYWYNGNLNLVQKKAIRNILRGEAQGMAYIIFGPPGTGKTMTLVEAIMQITTMLPNSRILVATPSNSSADLIATRLIENGHIKPGDFVRLVSQNLIEKELIPEHLTKYCATVDVAAEGSTKSSMITTESGLKLKCQMKYLGQQRVTISTCSTIGNFLQLGFPSDHFTHVIIDEAGQCTEPETLMAISQVSSKRGQVILAGDPYQLNPIVLCKFAGTRGLEISLLERLLRTTPYQRDIVRFPDTAGYNPRLVTKLINNYRALPSILHVYNKLFYNSELLPMVADDECSEAARLHKQVNGLLPKSEIRNHMHATFFQGIRGVNKQDEDSPSWYNPMEARTVFMLTINLYLKKVPAERIGIITPYQKQVRAIRSLFEVAEAVKPKIGTVEEFQGQERDIIIISTVRSSSKYLCSDITHFLGFVQSPKRMNVAISRARYLLFVCGNPHVLMLDNCWSTLIKYCIENDAYTGCNLPAALCVNGNENENFYD